MWSVPDIENGFSSAELLAQRELPYQDIGYFVPQSQRLFFPWRCAEEPKESCLWSTDGTSDGTQQWPIGEAVTASGSIDNSRWTAIDADTLLIPGGDCLKAVDTSGQGAVRDLRCGDRFQSQTPVGGSTYLIRSAQSGGELWKTDGTSEGTVAVDIPGLQAESIYRLSRVDNQLLVVSTSAAAGIRVLAADESQLSSVVLIDPVDGPNGEDPILFFSFYFAGSLPHNNVALFTFGDTSEVGQTWSTDGSVTETRKLTGADAVVGGPSFGDYGRSRVVSGEPDFMVYPVLPTSFADWGLPTWWVTDGTLPGTSKILTPNRGSSWPQLPIAEPSGGLMLLARTNLTFFPDVWRVSDTATALKLTVPKTDRALAAGSQRDIQAATESQAFFLAKPEIVGDSDLFSLSADGEVAPVDTTGGPLEGAREIYSHPTRILTPYHSSGGTPWAAVDPTTNVTSVSSALITRVRPGPETVYEWNDDFYLSTSNGLWSVDADGTFLQRASLPENTFHFHGSETTLFFTSSDEERPPNYGLWASNAAGTTQLLGPESVPKIWMWEWWLDPTSILVRTWFYDLRPPAGLATVRDQVIFAGSTEKNGVELWTIRDGEEPQLVKDLASGAESSYPRFFFSLANRIFFVANDGVHGEELWTSDGTATGTRMVADLNPGPVGSRPRELIACGSRVCFSAFTQEHGRELWQIPTDSPFAPSAHLLADIASGSQSSSPSQLMMHNGDLYFTANDGSVGFELWKLPFASANSEIFTDGFESGSISAWTADR